MKHISNQFSLFFFFLAKFLNVSKKKNYSRKIFENLTTKINSLVCLNFQVERERADLSVQVIQLSERLEEAEGGAESQVIFFQRNLEF